MSDPDGVGPPVERLPAQREDQWQRVVAAVSDGLLQFSWPFDPATSEALRGNCARGRSALTEFVDRRGDLRVQFNIQVHAVVGTVRREVLGTTVPTLGHLVALLQMLIDESEEQEQDAHGVTGD